MNQPQDQNHHPINAHRPPESRPKHSKEQPDFFEQLQAKDQRHGLAARGSGHGWTTFIEILLSDW
ncbi:MAG: hypothetical protein AAGG51_21780 [Cyanobacteria bacterium P01_G01_bin.54]